MVIISAITKGDNRQISLHDSVQSFLLSALACMLSQFFFFVPSWALHLATNWYFLHKSAGDSESRDL